jgi:hypothetical protein
MEIRINGAILLKRIYKRTNREDHYENVGILSGTYTLYKVEIKNEIWLFVKGRDIGQSKDFWQSWMKGRVVPVCKEAQEYFKNPSIR